MGDVGSHQGRGRALLRAASIVVSVGLMATGASAAPPVPTVPTVPLTPLVIDDQNGFVPIDDVTAIVRAALTDETLQRLKRDHLAFWINYSTDILENGNNYCSAEIGLSEVSTVKGRASRIPDVTFMGAMKLNEHGPRPRDTLRDCASRALMTAANAMAKLPFEGQLGNRELTREKGVRKPKPASDETASLFSNGVSEAARQEIYERIPSEFRKAFDYRRLQFVVLAHSARFGDVLYCYATVGVAAPPPENRNPRLSGHVHTHSREVVGEPARAENAERICRDGAAVSGVTATLEESWDDRGLLAQFSFAQEAGVQPVSNYKAPDLKALRASKLAQFRQSLKVGSDSHCGLVVDVKGPIAKVQTMIGEVWLKTAQLFPKDEQSCRFVNGVYQDP